MDLLKQIHRNAQEKNRHIVLPEGEDERMILAASDIAKRELCEITIVGQEESVSTMAEKNNVSLAGVHIIDPAKSELLDTLSAMFYEQRKHKGITLEQAKEQVLQPLFFGAMMIKNGQVDGGVAGALNTTGDVLKAGLQCIGLAQGLSVVSGAFLMLVPSWHEPLSYADAGVCPNPKPNQLASIAISTAKTHQKLTGNEPIVAMLSFSTMGSANHPMVDKVKEATEIVKEKAPELKVDGELQVDAALIEAIGKKKAPHSDVAGKANVLVFPDLNSGNIAYKLTERLAQAKALGPLVQGLDKPFMDLSRGCSVEDIVNVVAISCVIGDD